MTTTFGRAFTRLSSPYPLPSNVHTSLTVNKLLIPYKEQELTPQICTSMFSKALSEFLVLLLVPPYPSFLLAECGRLDPASTLTAAARRPLSRQVIEKFPPTLV